MNKTETPEQIRAQVLTEFKDQRDELIEARRRLQNVLLGAGHIVTVQGLALRFDIADGEAKNPTPCGGAHRANRFSKRDAETVAAAVVNGNGTKGRAIHVKDAIDEEIANLDNLISQIESRAAGAAMAAADYELARSARNAS